MKYVIEFGVRGGAHVDNLIVPTQKLAKELAQHLVMVFTNDQNCDEFRDYAKGREIRRASWTSSTHFVSVSPLDGVMRGPASATLWKLKSRSNNMKTISLHFYSDPGHGWLKVPLKLLEDLQIQDQISPYSYVKNTCAYLEEDADAYLFSKAAEKAGIQVKVAHHTCNRESAIRNLQSYTQQNIANIRKVPVVGMEIVYGGDFYTLLRPLGSGSWEVSNRYGAISRMKAGKLSCAAEVKAA